MTRNAMLLIVVVVVGVAGSGLFKFLGDRATKDLKERLSAQAVTAAATDVLVAQVLRQAALDSARADSVTGAHKALRDSITNAKERTSTATVRVAAIAATIDEDTLTADVQALLAAQRDLCEACADERDLQERRADDAESELTLIGPHLDSALGLVVTLQRERDDASDLAGDAIDQLQPNWFRLLLADLPQKAACAVGGGVVAQLNEGKVLVGAVVALGVCLAVGGIL